jgi:hypothetical protein
MSGSRGGPLAVALGAVAVAAVPAACALAAFSARVPLLRAVEASVAVAVAAGLASVAAYRRARAAVERSVRRRGERTVRVARLLALAGLYLGVTGALALAFYGLLRLRS